MGFTAYEPVPTKDLETDSLASADTYLRVEFPLEYTLGLFPYLASFFDCPVEWIPSLDLVFFNNLIFHFIILCY